MAEAAIRVTATGKKIRKSILGRKVGMTQSFDENGCRVPVTVLAVKDRVFGHNPLAALYTSETYYKRLKNRLE